jgi:hypothetical protein
MRLMLAGMALFLVVGCKVNQSQLADSGNSSGAVCSPELAAARVKGQGSTNSGGPIGLALNGEEDPAYHQLRRIYSHQFTQSSNDFLKAYSSRQTRADDIGKGCSRYATLYAENRCRQEGCRTGWLRVDDVEKRQGFVSLAIRECRSAFEQYFASKQSIETPQAQEPSATGSGSGTDTQTTTDTSTHQAIGPQDCRTPTEQDLVSNIEWTREYCQRLGGTFVDSAVEGQEPSCLCSAGARSMRELAVQSIAAECGQNIESPKQSNAEAPTLSPSPSPAAPSLTPSVPKPVEPAKPTCVCRLVGTQCQKFVGDKVAASLTVQTPNPVTKRNESCKPGQPQDGYDNLCNQPQIKCN